MKTLIILLAREKPFTILDYQSIILDFYVHIEILIDVFYTFYKPFSPTQISQTSFM